MSTLPITSNSDLKYKYDLDASVRSLKENFNHHYPVPVNTRIDLLKKLRNALVANCSAMEKALWKDFRKSPTETFLTEYTLILQEIDLFLNRLHGWCKPKKVKNNFLNLFSKSLITPRPKGVILIISPWNYPFLLSISPLVGAIAAGNVVVVKPSEFAPASSHLIARIVEESLGPSWATVIEGPGEVVVPSLMQMHRFDHIFYTGSTAVGRKIYSDAALNLTPVTLELGGKSPAIVLSDANLLLTAKRIVQAKFSNTGQICVAPDYLLVEESVFEPLLQKLKETILQFYGEDPKLSPDFGRIIHPNRWKKLKSYLQKDQIWYGGAADEQDLYIAPTVLTNVRMSDPVMQEEIFGPVLPVIPYTTENDLKQWIDQNPDPLALYVFSKNEENARQLMRKIPFGGGCINNASFHVSNHYLPFGGIRNSGIGRYRGYFSFELFSHWQSTVKTPIWLDPSQKYPPYGTKLNWLKKILNK